MNKANLLKITNVLLFISAAIQVLTGVTLFFDLFIAQAKVFEFITQVHRHNGPVFALLVALHLSLNWGWIKNQFFSKHTAS